MAPTRNVGSEPLLLDQAWRRMRERARGASGVCVVRGALLCSACRHTQQRSACRLCLALESGLAQRRIAPPFNHVQPTGLLLQPALEALLSGDAVAADVDRGLDGVGGLQRRDASHLPPRCQSVDLLRAPRPDSVARSRPFTGLSLPRSESAWAGAREAEAESLGLPSASGYHWGGRDALQAGAEKGLLATLLPLLSNAGLLEDDVFEVPKP